MPGLWLVFSLFLLTLATRYFNSVMVGVSNFVSWAPRFAIARLIAKWRSLLTIIAGVTLGASIGALVPLYTTAVAQFGLVQRMEDETLQDTNIQMRISLKPTDFVTVKNADALRLPDYSQIVPNILALTTGIEEAVINPTIADYLEVDNLENWVERIVPYVETDKMGMMDSAGETILGTRASLIYLEGWESRVRLVDGELPSRAAVPEGVQFNVAVGLNVANELNFAVGDILTIDQQINQPNGARQGWASSRPFRIHISAIVAEPQERDPFWMGTPIEYNPPLTLIHPRSRWSNEFKFLSSQENITEVVNLYSRETNVDFGWRIVLDHENLSYVRIEEARAALRNLELDLSNTLRTASNRNLNYFYHTRLIDFSDTQRDVDNGILLDYKEKQEVNAGPFTLLLLQVGALVLFFLMVTAMLVRRGERREIAVMQSRGAWESHILALRGIEALIICVVGGLAAPFISQQVLVVLAPIVVGTDEFPLPLTGNVFMFSLLAGGVAFLALMVTLIPVLRLPLISAGGAAQRSHQMAWWQRYYVDVMIAVLMLAVLAQLISRDTPLVETNLGDRQVDVLLLMAPAGLFLGLGSIALRLFPVVMSFLAALAAGNGVVRGHERLRWQSFIAGVVIIVVALGLRWAQIEGQIDFLTTLVGDVQLGTLVFLALLVIGGVLIFVRLLPWVAAPISGMMARREGMPGTMALWQLSREPVHYARITFLLALAVAIGWFATSFRATVRSSQADQARYIVGGDAIVKERDTVLGVDRVRLAEYYVEHPEVVAASAAFRANNVSYGGNRPGDLFPMDILAIDPRQFGEVTLDNWRHDLGNIRVPYLPETPLNIPTVGEALPNAPSRIGVWARADQLQFSGATGTAIYQPDLGRLVARVRLGLRLQDETGTWILAPLQAVRIEYLRSGVDRPGFGTRSHVPSGWVYYEADLSRLEYQPVGELRLVSVYWTHRSNFNFGEQNVRLSLAQMSLIGADGATQPFKILTEGNWQFRQHSGAESNGAVTLGNVLDTLRCDPEGRDPVTGMFSVEACDTLYIIFDQTAALASMGINVNYPDLPPMQGIISKSLNENYNVLYGEEASPFSLPNVGNVPVQIQPAMVTEYFPTMYNDRRPFVIVDVRELMYWLNARPAAQVYPTEMWLKFSDEVEDVDEVEAIFTDLTTQDGRIARISEASFVEEFDQLETDPLALGLLGLMFLAFIIALSLSIVGLLTYAGLTAQTRRNEFGVLRALGLSSSRVVGSLMFEQFFVVLIGGIVGSVLGYVLSIFVVPTLALGTTGEGVVPPFITETEWAAVGNFWLIMGGVLAAVATSSFLLVRQLSLTRTLRLGDE